jgi:nuclear RNA export factor
VSVPAEDAAHVLRLDGYVFSGTNIKIERASAQDSNTPGVSKESTVAMLKGVLARRFNVELKLLDLSALAADPDLKASAIFDSRSTTSKFFPALMKVLDQQFQSHAELNNAIISVSLANNELGSVSPVTTLAQTLPHLKNLDLSNNALKDLAALEAWRRKFSKLDHLVVSGNPLEQAEPEYVTKLVSWYPKLRLLNNIQVRSDQDAENGRPVTDMPFPIRSPNFQDEGQIAENFLRTFFAGYDTDRATLAQHYYDEQSDFSFSVNTGAPRDPSKARDTAPQEWDLYIKRSRNMKRITQLPARQSRLCRGAQAIHESWSSLPATRHPDLATQPQKWLIECQSQPGIPDPTGASPVGVDGFLITVHGEFDEIDVSTGQANKTRSFDRTFILGPGGPTGVRVVNDMMTVRAYGGFAAFVPEQTDIQIPVEATIVPGLPVGLTAEVAEQMVIELQKQTSMTVNYAKDCLEQVQWDFDRALQAFAAVRANLPGDAFVHPV